MLKYDELVSLLDTVDSSITRCNSNINPTYDLLTAGFSVYYNSHLEFQGEFRYSVLMVWLSDHNGEDALGDTYSSSSGRGSTPITALTRCLLDVRSKLLYEWEERLTWTHTSVEETR